ncbi:hypothetical protein [Inhella crocodyli]|uniref:Uncharacterized protein n=1 Tax=Inhella crocodyli TaxID=2499851 RepID=A0A3S2WL44_9BURK|nr:hypothetical protein [Inhella crocodyli]RVT82416.1 hypothetical protein EOD73_16925 [Inhella crocodyli]
MRLRVIGHGDGKVYFYGEGDALKLYGYDLKTRHFIGEGTIQGTTPTAMVYAPGLTRVFVGDGQGQIRAYGPDLRPVAGTFATTPMAVRGLAAAGTYLVAQDDSGAWASHHVFDGTGKRVMSEEWNHPLTQWAWDANSNRLYYFRDGMSPNDLMYERIDPTTGRIVERGESPYHGSYNIQGPIRVSSDGSKVLLGSGDVYAAPALTWSGRVPVEFQDADWLSNGELAVVANDRLTRYDVRRTKVEELTLGNGQLLAMVKDSGKTVLVVKRSDRLDFVDYEPSDDSDKDGYANAIDKFPLDRTAAVDTDNDGYPDAFLPGFTQADSPTGLKLDHYPQDAACYALEQGDGRKCNPLLYAPAPGALQAMTDAQGQVLLFAADRDRLYRWSPQTRTWLSPLAVGQVDGAGRRLLPKKAAYSSTHRRIYLGYENGQITAMDTVDGATERAWAQVALPVLGVAAVGEHVMAVDASGAWATHYVFDASGKLTDSKEWNYVSEHFEWAPTQSRVYFFRDGTSPNDLHYERISAAGKIVESGETPYHGEVWFTGPIRVSQGGARIALGTGDVYSTVDLRVVAQLGGPLTDLQWLSDESLVSVGTEGGCRLTRHNSSLALSAQQSCNGQPQALARVGDSLWLMSWVQGQLVFSQVSFP